MHDFTNKVRKYDYQTEFIDIQVIEEKENELKLKKSKKSEQLAAENGKGSRLALLDLLLDMHEKGVMKRHEISEQVDTFMFEVTKLQLDVR